MTSGNLSGNTAGKTIDPSVIEDIAARIRQAEASGVAIPPVRDELEGGGVQGAYAVQAANTAWHVANGRRLVGRKIGLTAKAVQAQLGVDSPDFGMLFADMEVADGEEIVQARLMQPRVEAEISLVLGRDLKQEQLGITEIMSAIEYALPSIEIVGSRIENWNIRLLDTVADNASSGLFVLGGRPVKIDALDWRLCGMVMERRGEQISLGAGAACLGNPLNAALWLARTMVEAGAPLLAGDIIMTGALGPMAIAAPGDVIEARINGLGSVRAVFAND
ncbi:MAG: fumarylacetoacetate hydrolase family protein [Hyphomicrobiales bacterium]|nr:fumarylacetoacetate hydrolase family protein [Hyphomicrobiales bacterium]